VAPDEELDGVTEGGASDGEVQSDTVLVNN
jgi:hypothetical protein